MTWLYEAALIVTGVTAVYGVAHSLARRTGRPWACFAGAVAAAILIAAPTFPYFQGDPFRFFFAGVIVAVMVGWNKGYQRRLREQGAAESPKGGRE